MSKTILPILNTAILTEFGEYQYKPLNAQEARKFAQDCETQSFVGHQATASIISRDLGIICPCNRVAFSHQVGVSALVLKLRGRPAEGKILNEEEIEAIGYDYALLTRI